VTSNEYKQLSLLAKLRFARKHRDLLTLCDLVDALPSDSVVVSRAMLARVREAIGNAQHSSACQRQGAYNVACVCGLYAALAAIDEVLK
jgi:hypothetical protein